MNKAEIEKLCDLAWQEKFLELTGHKIGDEVKCNFTTYYGNAKQSYMSSTEGIGIITKTDKGIFIKSKETYPTAHSEKYRSLSRTYYWVYRDEYVMSKLSSMIIDN